MDAARSARDRMQRRLYANAGREFDRGPTFPLREGARICTSRTSRLALVYARELAGLFQPCRANAREGTSSCAQPGNRLCVTQLIGGPRAEKSRLSLKRLRYFRLASLSWKRLRRISLLRVTNNKFIFSSNCTSSSINNIVRFNDYIYYIYW